MHKKCLVLVVIFLAVFAGKALGEGLELKLACPNTVKVNQPLNVTVYLYNRSLSSITVNRLMTGLTGNSQGTLIAGLWGPYNRPLSYPRIVPPHGTVNPFQITIINQVPQSLVNKMAMAFVAAITSNGQDQGGNVCGAAVVP